MPDINYPELHQPVYTRYSCVFLLSCVIFAALNRQRWLGSYQQFVFSCDLLPSTHRCQTCTKKDNIFPSLNSWVTAAFLAVYYFMRLSEYQMYFQDCPPAWRQSKPLCPLINIMNVCILILRTTCFFMIRDIVVYDHQILQGLLGVNSRRRPWNFAAYRDASQEEYYPAP